jgi:DtxR family transcriptional regulator, Mn-dependent transcriptional regulator
MDAAHLQHKLPMNYTHRPATDRKLPDEMAEVLEAIWTLTERGQASLEEVLGAAAVHATDELLRTMEVEQLISIGIDCSVTLTPAGVARAKQIMRRHRLAERLICDVLGLAVEDSEGPACEFEHLIEEGVTNSICTLLGHPRLCPHNRPIPEGECCRQAREELRPIVVPCSQLALRESARIAYLGVREHQLLNRLSALGIRPGATVKLLQKWPTYVVLCEETEIALEEAIARNIHVWHAQQD